MRKVVLSCLVLLFSFLLISCGSSSDTSPLEDRVAIVDDSVQGGNGGFFVSLDENSVIPIKERDNIETQQPKKGRITADLWVEPDDPEVAAVNDKVMNPYLIKGTTTKLTRVFSNYEDIKFIPSGVTWKRRLSKENVKRGTVFLVQSAKKKIYKVRIDHVSESLIQITYREIRSLEAN